MVLLPVPAATVPATVLVVPVPVVAVVVNVIAVVLPGPGAGLVGAGVVRLASMVGVAAMLHGRAPGPLGAGGSGL